MNKNETIHERITQLVDTFGKGKNTVFASLIGSNEANVRGYKTSVMPKFDFLEKIAKSFDIDLKWLLTGEGSMLRSEPQSPTNQAHHQDLSGEAAAYYRLYEKKDAEVGALKEEIGALKAKLAQYEPETEDSKVNPKGLSHAKDASTKKPSSPNADNATSATAP